MITDKFEISSFFRSINMLKYRATGIFDVESWLRLAQLAIEDSSTTENAIAQPSHRETNLNILLRRLVFIIDFTNNANWKKFIFHERNVSRVNLPTKESPLRFISDSVLQSRASMFSLARKLQHFIAIARMCSYGHSNAKVLAKIDANNDKFRNFDILIRATDYSISCRCVQQALRIITVARREIITHRQSMNDKKEIAANLANEIEQLTNEYEQLINNAKSKYGDWYEYDPSSPSTLFKDSEITTKQNDDESVSTQYFISAKRWNTVNEIDRLEKSTENLRELLLDTKNEAIQLLVHEQISTLERETLEVERQREARFENTKEEIIAETRKLEDDLAKLRDLNEKVTIVENVNREVTAVISKVTKVVIEELNEQRAKNKSITVELDNTVERTFHAMRLLAHKRTGSSKLSESATRYVKSVSFPRIVNCSYMRTMFDDICRFNCERIILDARQTNIKNLKSYEMINVTRDCLIACLYFYGISDAYVTLIETWYNHITSVDQVFVPIDKIYQSADKKRFFPGWNVEDRFGEGVKLFYDLKLDLRICRKELFRLIVNTFRNRAVFYEKSIVLTK